MILIGIVDGSEKQIKNELGLHEKFVEITFKPCYHKKRLAEAIKNSAYVNIIE